MTISPEEFIMIIYSTINLAPIELPFNKEICTESIRELFTKKQK